MLFDRAALLSPVSDADPFGTALIEHPLYDDFRSFSNASDRVDWGRQLERALRLAQETRDLRAWIWLTRSSICAEGLPGLAAGLQLIADGLERYWEMLPPQHANENDPTERYMMRLSALTQLGATHYACSLSDLQRFSRNFTDLQADLQDAIARATPDEAAVTAANDARQATARICQAFSRGFPPEADPMVNFDTITARLREIGVVEASTVAHELAAPTAAVASEPKLSQPPAVLGPVRSRSDVIRTLDLLMAYYETHEPCSPVPLLIARAKRLVPSTFMQAIKDLAPGGLNELKQIAGTEDDNNS
jgi:type VI secretion system protein ImpA